MLVGADPPAPAAGHQRRRRLRHRRHLPADPRRLLPDARHRDRRRAGKISLEGGIAMDTEMLIGSRFEKGTEHEEKILNPRTGETILDAARGLARPGRRGRRRRGEGLRHLVAHHAGRARRLSPQARRARSRRRRTASPTSRRSTAASRATPCPRRDRRRSSTCFRFFAGAARVVPGLGGGRISARLHLDGPPRPDRRRRLDRAVELSADDGGVEDRAGASPPATRWC